MAEPVATSASLRYLVARRLRSGVRVGRFYPGAGCVGQAFVGIDMSRDRIGSATAVRSGLPGSCPMAVICLTRWRLGGSAQDQKAQPGLAGSLNNASLFHLSVGESIPQKIVASELWFMLRCHASTLQCRFFQPISESYNRERFRCYTAY